MANETATVEVKQVTENNKEETCHIEVKEYYEFKPIIEHMIINTIELSEIINGFFGGIMRDYYGCRIKIANGNNVFMMNNEEKSNIPLNSLYVELYFRDNSKDRSGAYPIETINYKSIPNKNGVNKSIVDLAIINANSGPMAARMYVVDPKTYEALDEFRFYSDRKVKWENLTKEITNNVGYTFSVNQENILVISGISLNKVIAKLYGEKNDESNKKCYEYRAQLVGFLNNNDGRVLNTENEYVLEIQKMNSVELARLRKSLGSPIAPIDFHQFIG